MEHLMKETNKEAVWKQVQEFYLEKFGITPDLIEIATNIDILKMCATGASNETIGNFFEVDTETVSYIIDKHLGFRGFDKDQPNNAYRIYNDLDDKSLDMFIDAVTSMYGNLVWPVETIYNAVRQVSNLEGLLDEKWI